MPTYEYVCSGCQNAWEEIQKISEPALEVCPKCTQHTAKRQISGGRFILKGGGWYADLYSSQKPGKSSGDSGGTKSEAKSETKTESSSASTSKDSSSSSGSTGSSGSSGGAASTSSAPASSPPASKS